MTMKNPVLRADVNFAEYVRNRKAVESRRMDGNGVPNYAYAMDYELRRRLDSIPGLYRLGRTITATVSSRRAQLMNMAAAKVGPTQFPEVYKIACDCARILGIGIPNVFILNDQTLNAYTMACDDVEPIIVIHSGLYERLTEGELRCVIGHECGHIHNQHGVYDVLSQIVFNSGMALAGNVVSRRLLQLVTAGAEVALASWQRAAEVTCDRAGMICAADLSDAYTSEAKFMFGAAFGEREIDLDAIREQLETQMNNITRIVEVSWDHPATARRIAAEMEFEKCELLYQWRPDLKKPGATLYSKEETDARCHKVIDLGFNR